MAGPGFGPWWLAERACDALFRRGYPALARAGLRGARRTICSPRSRCRGRWARNVRDLALFLDTMAGPCPSDPLTFDAPCALLSGRGDRGRAATPGRLHSQFRRPPCRLTGRRGRSAPSPCATGAGRLRGGGGVPGAGPRGGCLSGAALTAIRRRPGAADRCPP